MIYAAGSKRIVSRVHTKAMTRDIETMGVQVPPCRTASRSTAKQTRSVHLTREGVYMNDHEMTSDEVASDVAEHRRRSRKQDFVKRLAKFLVDGQASKSILLATNNSLAREWADLRSATPLFGYPTIEEAEKMLNEFLK